MRLNNIDSTDFYSLLDFLKDNVADPYVTGGTLRDYMMGNPKSNDVDLTIGSPIDVVAALINGTPFLKSIVEVGKSFGVIRIVLKDGLKVDIAQFRAETYEEGSRKPTSVTLVKTIEEDLARRDFTINSMAARYEGSGEFSLIDPYNGLGDINNKVIRAVGNPLERFKEDPLRIMRAIRFAVRFKFTIAEGTLGAIKKMKKEIA